MTKKDYNDQFISTFTDSDYEVDVPPFLVGQTDIAIGYRKTLEDALDVTLHEDILDDFEIDAAHRLMKALFYGLKADTVITNAAITAIARSLFRHSEVFPAGKAEELLEEFRAYVNRHRRLIIPGG